MVNAQFPEVLDQLRGWDSCAREPRLLFNLGFFSEHVFSRHSSFATLLIAVSNGDAVLLNNDAGIIDPWSCLQGHGRRDALGEDSNRVALDSEGDVAIRLLGLLGHYSLIDGHERAPPSDHLRSPSVQASACAFNRSFVVSQRLFIVLLH